MWKKVQIVGTQVQYTFKVVKTEKIFVFLVKEKFITYPKDHRIPNKDELRGSVRNIGFDGYISTWILLIYQIYRRYIGGYFYMNIDISEINKNGLKFMEILCKSVRITLIMKYRH